MAESSFGKPVVALAAGGALLLVIFVIILVNLGGDDESAQGVDTTGQADAELELSDVDGKVVTGSDGDDLDELVLKVRRNGSDSTSGDEDEKLERGTVTFGPKEIDDDSEDESDRITTSTTRTATSSVPKTTARPVTTERVTTTAKPTTTAPQVKSGTAEEHFIERLYLGVLGRNPDSGGFDFWVRQLEASGDAESIVKRFLDSAKVNESVAGIDVVLERLLGGRPSEAVISAFEKESEERGIYLAVNNTTVVDRFNHKKL